MLKKVTLAQLYSLAIYAEGFVISGNLGSALINDCKALESAPILAQLKGWQENNSEKFVKTFSST